MGVCGFPGLQVESNHPGERARWTEQSDIYVQRESSAHCRGECYDCEGFAAHRVIEVSGGQHRLNSAAAGAQRKEGGRLIARVLEPKRSQKAHVGGRPNEEIQETESHQLTSTAHGPLPSQSPMYRLSSKEKKRKEKKKRARKRTTVGEPLAADNSQNFYSFYNSGCGCRERAPRHVFSFGSGSGNGSVQKLDCAV